MTYTWIPAKDFKKGRDDTIQSIILHATDGHEQGDIATLTEHHEGSERSVHWYVNRLGQLWHFVQNTDTAYHVGQVIASKYSNAASIGIEQEHVTGEDDWPDVQVQTTARLVAGLRLEYGNLPVKSHAEVAFPAGRKEDPKDFPWAQFSHYVSGFVAQPDCDWFGLPP